MKARDAVIENHAAASEALRILEASELSAEDIMRAGRMLSLAGAQLMSAGRSVDAGKQVDDSLPFDPRRAAANDRD